VFASAFAFAFAISAFATSQVGLIRDLS